MSDKVISLHKQSETNDIVKGLRNLADKIEKGEVEDMPVITTCVLVIGHTKDTPTDEGGMSCQSWHDVYSWGPRQDSFTLRGLLFTALNLD